jgi:hypothetical protein
VHAVDRDPAGATALAGVPGVTFDPVDLEVPGAWDDGAAPAALRGRRYDGIVVARYLHRPLLPWLAQALDAGGLLVYETFAEGQQRFGRPGRSDFLLRPGELLDVFGASLEIVAYEDGVVQSDDGQPARVQRLCARRSAADGLPLQLGRA